MSIGTVSNVLNRPDAVAPSTRQRVLEVIAELGYVRNDSARQLRAGRSRTIAIVVLDVANPFFTDVVRGAEVAAAERGAMVVVCNSGEDADRERRHLELLEEQRVQGVLITPVDDGRDSRLEQLISRGTPVVLVDRGTGRHRPLLGRRRRRARRPAGRRPPRRPGPPPGRRSSAARSSIPQVADRHAGLTAALADVADARLEVFATPSLTVAAGRAVGERARRAT